MPSCNIQARLRASWATHWPVGWAVTPPRWTLRLWSSIKKRTWRRWNQTVSTVKKSVASIAGRVLADELAPTAGSAAGSGWDALAAQDLGHAHVGDLVAELEHLALDSAIAPRWVLPSEPEGQLSPLAMASRAWSWRAPGKGGPLAANQLAMPPEEGLRPGQQGGQTGSRP